ncbi:hypothetical protein Tco_0370223 [Tanacetum coccineum]
MTRGNKTVNTVVADLQCATGTNAKLKTRHPHQLHSNGKSPINKRGEYDIWSMRMRQYICHTDHNLCDIIVNGDLQEESAPTGDQSSPSAPSVPKTAKQLAAKRNQEKTSKRSCLFSKIPDEYLLKFHNVPDAKSL